MDARDSQAETEQPPAESIPCPDCGQSYKTPQGLAGHRRLAHSASTVQALDERDRELTEHRRALESKASEVARREAAAKRRETELGRREQVARETEDTPESERIGRVVRREIASLPEVTPETILRVRGADYRIEDGRLRHLYWPKGEKAEFEEGQWFQFGGRAHCIRDGKLRAVRSSSILASFLNEEE
jgi:hypothetical protein